MRSIYKCLICGEYVEEKDHCGRATVLLMNGVRRLKLSKLISYILRHDPEAVNLTLTNEGWADIRDLIYGIKNFWRNKEEYQWIEEQHIIALAKLDPKGRFEIRNDLIRARYGHSKWLKVEISYEMDLDSKILYHGTSFDRLVSIMSEGIKPMKRKYVHLSVSIADAYYTAARHGGKPVILVIDCDKLRDEGINIFIASNKVRLARFVPPKCIKSYYIFERISN